MSNALTFSNGTHIIWEHGLDGGGSTQYIDFLSYLKNNGKKYNQGLEWCCGMGSIGYSIMDSKICNNMSFMDIYEPAGKYVYLNADRNNMSSNVTFYHADTIKKLPNTVKFDLVVANPPHTPENFKSINDDDIDIVYRLTVDDEWKIHTDFFKNIKFYLNSGADVILSEINTHSLHIELAEDNGLRYIGSTPAIELGKNSSSSAVLMHYRYEEKIY